MGLPTTSHAEHLGGFVKLALRFIVDRFAHFFEVEIGEHAMSIVIEYSKIVRLVKSRLCIS